MGDPQAILEENARLRATVAELEQKVVGLQARLEWFLKHVFGPGKSEKIDTAQLHLGLEEAQRPVDQQTQKISGFERKRPKPSMRQPAAEHFANVPVCEEVVIEPPEVLKDPDLYERIGQEETFEVDITKPKLFRRKIIRPKYRHRIDCSRPPVVAPAPQRPVEGGYASAGLLSYIALSKYVDHLPLYRLERMSERWGAKLSRKTMCDWIGVTSRWLEPIHALVKKQLLAADYLQVDETPVNFNDPDLRDGKTTQGRMWVLQGLDGSTIYEWRLTRSESELREILADYGGILHTDAYQAYISYARGDPKRIRVGCWAHARRKFHDALSESPAWAMLILRQIGQLYALEREWDEAGYRKPQQRAHLRKRHFELPLKIIRTAVERLRARVLPKSGLGKACDYMLSEWNALLLHCDHGITRLDTNLVENAIRPSAVGKKNWLQIGAPHAGQRSAIIYSLVISCRNHGKDPADYLRDVLQRLPQMTNQDDLGALTPANWQPASREVQTHPASH